MYLLRLLHDPRQAKVADPAAHSAIVVDDEDRENEGDLIFAAETVSQQTMAFVVRHTSGVICTAMYGEDLDRLKLGPMVSKNEDPKGTAFAVTVDLKDGVTTGISAGDRARTIRALADPSSKPGHFCRPGHIFPLRARPGGVLERGGHTEAAVDMARLAGLHPAGGLCEIVRDEDGEMSRWDDLEVFAKEHDLAFTTIQDLKTYREQVLGEAVEEHVLNEAHDAVQERRVDLGKATRMPTSAGLFDAVCATDRETGLEHIAMLKGYTTDAYSYLQRADAARYFILHRFGGVYADLDIRPEKPIGPMLGDAQVLLPHGCCCALSSMTQTKHDACTSEPRSRYISKDGKPSREGCCLLAGIAGSCAPVGGTMYDRQSRSLGCCRAGGGNYLWTLSFTCPLPVPRAKPARRRRAR